MGFPFLTTARRVQYGAMVHGSEQAMPRQKASRVADSHGGNGATRGSWSLDRICMNWC